MYIALNWHHQHLFRYTLDTCTAQFSFWCIEGNGFFGGEFDLSELIQSIYITSFHQRSQICPTDCWVTSEADPQDQLKTVGFPRPQPSKYGWLLVSPQTSLGSYRRIWRQPWWDSGVPARRRRVFFQSVFILQVPDSSRQKMVLWEWGSAWIGSRSGKQEGNGQVQEKWCLTGN